MGQKYTLEIGSGINDLYGRPLRERFGSRFGKCMVPYGGGGKHTISQRTPDLSEPNPAFWIHSLREAIVGHKICWQARLEEAYA
jgi:hypothetical protein